MQATARSKTSSCEAVDGGYRLSNEKFEATISFRGASPGITHLSSRGGTKRQAVKVQETPITLRLATDAPRIDIASWSGHAGSGNSVPPEDDWGIALKLHEQPAGPGSVQRITDFPVGPPWYTDMYYPGYYWYRTMLALPKEWQGKPVVFVLGGCDEFNWRAYWVYLNGQRIGQSSHDDTYLGPWHEVPRYVIKPEDAAYKLLKFGEPNQLSVQARGLDRRTPDMHRRDLERYSGASMLVDQYVAGGEPTKDLTGFQVVEHRSSVSKEGVASVELTMTHPSKWVSVTARYWLHPSDSAIHKQLTIHNEGNDPLTLLEADVLSFTVEKQPFIGGGQGWPLRIGEDWFAGVTHPAGVARWGKEGVRLQVIPGATLDPKANHDHVSKTAVVGVGNGRRAFVDYLQAHGRRKVQFLNMYSLYGLCEIATSLFPKVELTETLVMKNIEQMRALQKRDIRFDYYCIDTGWNDPLGDLKNFHPANFPNGADKPLKEIRDLGMKPLLWISPAAGPAVFRAGVQSPIVPPGGEDNNGTWGFYCLHGDKWRTTLRDAMLHHIKNNGVKGFKLDEVSFYCGRPSHGHLPNKYGIEKQMDAFIDTLDQCKKECPDLLLMLYWRFMSPWWLLHTDTIYQRGLQMEGATPSPQPSRLIRQSVTVSLDQGHDYNWDRMPLIGQDSLGVWLSTTRWGSWMGAEGWRDAWIMDFIRGNLMHQLWGDLGLLKDDDIAFMEAIAKFTKTNAHLLPNPRRILGSPWNEEPYGYACGDGNACIVAIHNANFATNTVQLALDSTLGLESDKPRLFNVKWVYKAGSAQERPTQTVRVGEMLTIELGSFEVCLLHITPAGAGSTTTSQPIKIPSRAGATKLPVRFSQTSHIDLEWDDPAATAKLARVMNGRTTPTLSPDTLAVGPDRSDERDRDIVEETLAAELSFSARDKASKLFVVARTDRDGIAWHHLAPFTIIQIAATGSGKKLEAKTTPRIVHEQAGGWSWILHEFDVPPGIGEIALNVDAVHPKTVSMTLEVWQSDE